MNKVKDARKIKAKGFTIIEIAIAIIAISILAAGMLGASKIINTAKTSRLQTDFASLETSCTQLMYERDGLTKDDADFTSTFNKYVDSNAELASGVMRKTDPWKTGYKVTFTKVGPAESKILIESAGKLGGTTSHALLVHYKNSEVRGGTAGFEENKGHETSDAAFTESSGATITNMWAK